MRQAMSGVFGAVVGIAAIAAVLAVVIGWFINVVHFVQTLPSVDLLQILRAIGIFVVPLGSILGFAA